ncbi:MAG: hypothetical protein LUQ65_13270 [Candidatus Helarchaeota archaeon]|nr:hypothetical protein [Candidatus Helarchaeota archaeon]
MLEECFHTKGNRHVNGEFEVYRVVLGEVAFIQTSPQLKETTVTIAREGDMFNVIPYYFHRAVNISKDQPLVTSDLRPLNTETSYSPIDKEGFPTNVVRDVKRNLFLWRKEKETIPLKDDLPEVQHVTHHSYIRIDQALINDIIKDAKKGQLKKGDTHKRLGYIMSNIQKISDIKEFYINPTAAAKVNEIAYITLDGRLEEINMINGLTIVLPGAVPI